MTITTKKSKAKPAPTSVQSLRGNGYKVFVTHHRFVDRACVFMSGEDADHIFTRKEFLKAIEENKMHFFDDRYKKFGDCVAGTGGYTEVEVITPSGENVKSKHSFGQDQFCKKNGLKIALQKLMWKIAPHREKKSVTV